jgi:hypothetical protein
MADISRSTISIRLFGSELNPEKITQLLVCEPSSAAKTGEKIIKRNGQERIVKKGFWRLAYGESDEVILEEKIELLFGKLTTNLDSWRKVTRNLDTVDIFCGLFIDNWNEGFTLSQSILKKISDRNLEIGFDIYSPTDTWDEKSEEDELSQESN